MRSFPLSATSTGAELAAVAGTARASKAGIHGPSEIVAAAPASAKKIIDEAMREGLRFTLAPGRRWQWPESVPPPAAVRYLSPPDSRKARRKATADRRAGGSWTRRERADGR